MADQIPGLDQNQLHFFKTFGYAVLRKLLKPDELEIIKREHRDGLAAAFPDEPFDGTLGQWTRMMNEETPFFASLTEDPRFLTPAQQICGEDVLGNGTDAHFSVGNTDWHSDSNWQTQFRGGAARRQVPLSSRPCDSGNRVPYVSFRDHIY